MGLVDEVYGSLTGDLECPLPWVRDAFEAGSICQREYQQIMDAYERLRQRLGVVDEDEDVEVMIYGFQVIQETLCKEMFRLGYRDGMLGARQ